MINCLCLRNHHDHDRFVAFVALFRKQSTGCDAGGGGSCRAARQLQGPFRPLDKLGQRHRRMRCTGHGDDTMSALRFRNITASVEDPVETWPFEGILTAVERGTLPDWRRLAAAIRADPWGPVAQQVSEAVEISHPYGTSELLTSVIEQVAVDEDPRVRISGRLVDCPDAEAVPGLRVAVGFEHRAATAPPGSTRAGSPPWRSRCGCAPPGTAAAPRYRDPAGRSSPRYC